MAKGPHVIPQAVNELGEREGLAVGIGGAGVKEGRQHDAKAYRRLLVWMTQREFAPLPR